MLKEVEIWYARLASKPISKVIIGTCTIIVRSDYVYDVHVQKITLCVIIIPVGLHLCTY